MFNQMTANDEKPETTIVSGEKVDAVEQLFNVLCSEDSFASYTALVALRQLSD